MQSIFCSSEPTGVTECALDFTACRRADKANTPSAAPAAVATYVGAEFMAYLGQHDLGSAADHRPGYFDRASCTTLSVNHVHLVIVREDSS